MITKIEFLNRDQIDAGSPVIDATYTRLYNIELSSDKLQEPAGYFIQTPKTFKFTLPEDSYLLDDVFDLDNDYISDHTIKTEDGTFSNGDLTGFSNKFIRVYDDDTHVFTGLIQFGNISRNIKKETVTIKASDVLILISSIKGKLLTINPIPTPGAGSYLYNLLNIDNMLEFIIDDLASGYYFGNYTGITSNRTYTDDTGIALDDYLINTSSYRIIIIKDISDNVGNGGRSQVESHGIFENTYTIDLVIKYSSTYAEYGDPQISITKWQVQYVTYSGTNVISTAESVRFDDEASCDADILAEGYTAPFIASMVASTSNFTLQIGNYGYRSIGGRTPHHWPEYNHVLTYFTGQSLITTLNYDLAGQPYSVGKIFNLIQQLNNISIYIDPTDPEVIQVNNKEYDPGSAILIANSDIIDLEIGRFIIDNVDATIYDILTDDANKINLVRDIETYYNGLRNAVNRELKCMVSSIINSYSLGINKVVTIYSLDYKIISYEEVHDKIYKITAVNVVSDDYKHALLLESGWQLLLENAYPLLLEF